MTGTESHSAAPRPDPDAAGAPPRRRGRVRLQELALGATFVGMAAYEAAEVSLLEAHRGTPIALAVALHALQVGAILAAAWTVLRAWRRRARHEEDLGRMVEQVTFAQEAERRRIGYELHDGVSPLIVSAKQHAETCRDLLAEDPALAAAELGRGIEHLQTAIVEIRQLLRALRPSAVDADGLAAAVSRTLAEAAGRQGWAVTFAQNLGDDRLPAAVETAAFRIVQEAITNAARHARTDRVDVALRREPGALRCEVRDHGVGFARGAAPGRGVGLLSMRERASLLGGECSVESDAGAGTRVRVRLPLREDAAR